MLVDGVPPEEVGIAANLLPDMSPDGIKRGYESGNVMAKPQTAFLPVSFHERLAHHPGNVRQGEVLLGGDVRVWAEEGSQGPGVRVQRVDAEVGWWLADPSHPQQQFANHFAAVRFHDGVPMVYDPGYDAQQPLTVAQWKAHQGYPESVAAVAAIGGPYRFALESAPDGEESLRQFFRFPEYGSRVASYSRDLRDLIVVQDALPGVTDDPAGVLRGNLHELAPLAAYERWLYDTDARIKLTIPDGRALVTSTSTSQTLRRPQYRRSDLHPER
jgi:hypothetical protein